MGQQPPTGGTKPRGPAIRKAIMLDTVRGAPRARQWPRGRTIAKGSPQAARNERFRIAQQFIKYLTAKEVFTVTEAVKGTPLMPRDVLTMLVYLRVMQLGPGGPGTVYSMATRRDVSESLDALGSIVGQGLVRGDEFWEQQPASGGGGGMEFSWHADSAPGINPLYPGAFQGGEYDCLQEFAVSNAASWIEQLSGSTYQVAIAEINTGSVIQAIELSNVVTAPGANTNMMLFQIGTTLEAGKRYAFLTGRTDGPANYTMPLPWLAPGRYNLPLSLVRRSWIASTAPAVGDTLTQVGASARSNFFGIGASI